MQWTWPRYVVPIFSVIAIAASALYSFFAPEPLTPAFDAVLGIESSFEGIVVRDPDIREKTILVTISVKKINDETIDESSKILLSLDRFSEVAYGDEVKVTGVLKRPEAFETESGRTFNYPKYLLAHGITHQMAFPKFSVVSKGNGNLVVAALLSLKHVLLSGLQKALPEPESALAAGLLLGEKQSLGDQLTEAFRRAGVVHIIVLSGYNVAVVISALLFIALRFLPRVVALTVAAVGVLMFALMTGASETTIRASIMALIALVAQGLHRPAEGLRILLIAAAGMALWNPYLVLYDLSYQLSILATLGLILFSNRLEVWFYYISPKLGLREITATTIATQITVLPLLIVSVGQVSLVSLISNILVLPAVELAMLVGFIASLVALVSTAIAFPFGAVAYGVLYYIIFVSEFFGSLPFAAIKIPPQYMWAVLLALAFLYTLLFVLLYVKSKKLSHSAFFGLSK